MSFTNVYYKRAVGTPKACYVCYRPTTTVLATINTVDFLYTCDGHLGDSGFATRLSSEGDSVKSTAVTAEEIARVKAEWEEKQRKKQEKEKEKLKEKEKQEKAKEGKEGDEGEKDEAKNKRESKPAKTERVGGTGEARHEKYALHRDYFAMRQAEHRRRRQAAQAKELAPRLPGTPRGV